MNPDTVKNGSIDYSKLKNVTLKSFQSFGAPSTVEEERKQVINSLKKSIDSKNALQIQQKMKEQLEKISNKAKEYKRDLDIIQALSY